MVMLNNAEKTSQYSTNLRIRYHITTMQSLAALVWGNKINLTLLYNKKCQLENEGCHKKSELI